MWTFDTESILTMVVKSVSMPFGSNDATVEVKFSVVDRPDIAGELRLRFPIEQGALYERDQVHVMHLLRLPDMPKGG